MSSNENKMFYKNCRIPYEKRVLNLKEAYTEWERASDSKVKKHKERIFFLHFPCSFSTFDSIYGYYPQDNNKGELRPMIDKHLELLFSTEAVLPAIKYKRIVEIAKDGSWDNGMEFQYLLQQDIWMNPSRYLEVIQQTDYSAQEIFSFWYFLFDGPHPENYKDDYNKLYNQCKELDSEIAELMRQAYEKLLSEDKCPGH
jgi:hypothetical protein